MPQTEQVGPFKVFPKKKLGRGAFGKVFRAQHKDGWEAAAKQIECDQNQVDVMREAELFLKDKVPKDHRNIIPIYDVHRSTDEGENSEEEADDFSVNVTIWIFMQLCEYGDLNKYSKTHPGAFGVLQNKIGLMHQVADGLKYLHASKVVHRDIKPANILLSEDPASPGRVVVKITDFGLCKFLDPHDMTTGMSTNVGTQFFKAPEFWDRGHDGKVRYNKAVDNFAAGLTFLAMIQPPNPNGQLIPRIEGPMQESERGNAIGQTIYYHQKYSQPAVVIVQDNDDDPTELKALKEVIRKAIRTDPEERLSSPQMYEGLGRLLDVNVSFLNKNHYTG